MTTAIQPSGKQGALLVAGILMIATTLRVTFTGVAPLLDTIRQDYGLSTAQTGLLTTLPPAGLRLDLSPCRRRRPAPGHGAQPFYRSAADLHRDWRTFAAVGLAVVYRYGDRGLRNCAGQCPVTRINQTRFPGPGRKTHGGVFADDGGRRRRRVGADRPAVAGECWLARGRC